MTTHLKRAIGKPFRKKYLLVTALTHPSYHNEHQNCGSPKDFQRFEFLGDSILNLFVAKKIYTLFPEADEGLLSRMRSILVSKKLLSKIARSLRLGTHLRLGERERKQPLAMREKMLADAFEALVASIYFDRGQNAVENFLLRVLGPHLDQKKLFRFDPNPKSSLQEFTQKKFAMLPEYNSRQKKESGMFTAWVTIKGKMKSKGEGRTKREAEVQAASALLKKLKTKWKTSSLK